MSSTQRLSSRWPSCDCGRSRDPANARPGSDHVAIRGRLGRTKKGEPTVWADEVFLASKSLRHPPEKWAGLQDVEQRYRMRYLDLIMNETSRETFRIRTRVVQFLRNYLNGHGFMEVETPMMQLIPGGAAARCPTRNPRRHGRAR